MKLHVSEPDSVSEHGAAEATPDTNLDSRREPRFAASGRVVVNAEGVEIRGRLIDVSISGFRMSHRGDQLHAGQQVAFRHPHAKGVATVVWNRIFGEEIETGFFVAE